MPPLIIGHRGAAGLEPENTLRSFRRALSVGVDAVETDVQLTSDGTPVCFHDDNLERLTGHSAPLNNLTLEELRRLDVGQGEQIPTLVEVIQTVRGFAALEIELKSSDCVEAVLKTLKEERIEPSEVIITSFDLSRLRQVKQERPDLRLSVLYTKLPADWLDAALNLGAVAVNLYFLSVTAEWIREAHEANLKARTWTVNEVEYVRRLIDMGVDSITTDRPDILRQQI